MNSSAFRVQNGLVTRFIALTLFATLVTYCLLKYLLGIQISVRVKIIQISVRVKISETWLVGWIILLVLLAGIPLDLEVSFHFLPQGR